MSTIANAVQAMVDNLTTKMSSGTPLTPEEQLLIAKALSALQDNETWEKAVVAVVEEHLTTGTEALAVAKDQFEATTIAGVNAMSSAEASLLAKAAQLDIAAGVPTALRSYVRNKDGLIGSVEDLLTVIPDAELLEDVAYGSVMPLVDIIFCSDGDVYAHACPTAASPGSANAGLNFNHNFYHKAAGLDAKTGAFTRTNYCHYSQDAVRTLWNHRYGYYPAMALLPLASSVDADAITFAPLISDWFSNTPHAANFRGIGLFYNNTYGVSTGHYHNATVIDRYGRKAATLTTDNRVTSYSECGLYDNTKNCLVVIEDGKVWELYSNGWVDPAIATFGDDTQAQAWVYAQPDIFIVPIRAMVSQVQSYHPLSSDLLASGKTQAQYEQAYINNNVILSRMATPAPANGNLLNAYASADVHYGLSLMGTVASHVGGAGMAAGYSTSQQYLWDVPSKTLIPTLREDFLESVPKQYAKTSATADNFYTTIKQRSVVKRLDTMEVLGEAQRVHFASTSSGHQGVDIPMYNPYDDVWYHTVVAYDNIGTLYHVGVSRLHRVAESIAQYIGQ